MAEWTPVEGYLALNLIEAAAEFAKLEQMMRRMPHDICVGEWASITGVRRQCNKLLEKLKTAEYAQSEEYRQARKFNKEDEEQAKLKVVTT